MTLHLMGSNTGVYVWIPMGCVKSLQGIPTKAISILACNPDVLFLFQCQTEKIFHNSELLIFFVMKAAILLLESRESVVYHYQIYNFWGSSLSLSDPKVLGSYHSCSLNFSS